MLTESNLRYLVFLWLLEKRSCHRNVHPIQLGQCPPWQFVSSEERNISPYSHICRWVLLACPILLWILLSDRTCETFVISNLITPSSRGKVIHCNIRILRFGILIIIPAIWFLNSIPHSHGNGWDFIWIWLDDMVHEHSFIFNSVYFLADEV